MAELKVGDKVRCSAEYDVNGTHLASFVRTTVYDVIQIGGRNLSPDRIVIGLGSAVTAAVHRQYLTPLNPEPEPAEPAVEEPVMPEEPAEPEKSVGDIMNSLLSSVTSALSTVKSTAINGSAIQLVGDRTNADEVEDDIYTVVDAATFAGKSDLGAVENELLDTNAPSKVQNASLFPPVKSTDTGRNGRITKYRYDYSLNYESDTLTFSNGATAGILSDLPEVEKSVNMYGFYSDTSNFANGEMNIVTRDKILRTNSRYYNKYKITNPNDALTKSFGHVFFVRPDCNIYAEGSSGNSPYPMLTNDLENLSQFYYAKKHSPELLRQLTQSAAGYKDEFMFLLSNKAKSFELSDEFIGSDVHSQSLTGYKIPYGKSNIESKTAEKFSVTYNEDRDLHIYNLHKLWTDYISYAYRGRISPKPEYMINKILDYSTCVYYILCAEDGETIIFWSKYWGVFPLDAPSSTYSWQRSDPLSAPELKIEYQYAAKEDFDPLSLIEFNEHSRMNNFTYVQNYQDIKIGTGLTWAGSPFIETFNSPNTLEVPYTFKLRFRPKASND